MSDDTVDFTFHCGEIIFGRGKVMQLGGIARRFGRTAMICTRGREMEKHGYLGQACASLKEARVGYGVVNLPANEPLIEEIDAISDRVRAEKPDLIIGLGGGSTLDTCKAVAGMATNPGTVVDYLEGAGRNLTLTLPALPCIAIPTTAGTGAEVTKNAVITRKHVFKKSLRSPFLIPVVALLDPDLTKSMPAFVTAETGMDAFTQLIESFISIKAQPIPRQLSLHGIQLVGKYLVPAVENGADMEAREGMMLASLLSGLALANSGLGAVHGIAAALGAVCDIPHGRACAMLLPHVMPLNLPERREAFQTMVCAFSGCCKIADGLPEEFLQKIECLGKRTGIEKTFSPDEVNESHLPALVRESRGSSMKGNPVELTDRQIENIIRKLL
ncbi:iron-containing alcohol dehydrogenase [candidate division KSB1 bacterium]|nr:iron-containing alcohol dehydrogenase [candidate division KSB1 bacterium]